jgi:hypothetical protein
MGIFVYHGIVVRDYDGKIVKNITIDNLDYFNRNNSYWFKPQYWSVINPIAPTEIGLPELSDGNYFHLIEESSTL